MVSIAFFFKTQPRPKKLVLGVLFFKHTIQLCESNYISYFLLFKIKKLQKGILHVGIIQLLDVPGMASVIYLSCASSL